MAASNGAARRRGGQVAATRTPTSFPGPCGSTAIGWGGRALTISVLTHAPWPSAESVEQIAGFVSGVEAKDAAVRQAVLTGFDEISLLADYLVPELLSNVEAPYLEMLFGERMRGDAISAQEFLRGVTLCAIGYHIDASGAGSFTMDYRLLVPSLVGPDTQKADRFLVFGGGYDITNQVLAAKFSGAGEWLDLSVES